MYGGPTYRAFLVAAGVVAFGSDLAVAQGDIVGTTPTVVLRGSTAAADGFAGTSSPPIVVRGSAPRPALAVQAPPAADTPCPAGYVLDPGLGCVPLGYASEPYDYDWLYGYPVIERRQRFARRWISGRGRQFRPGIARTSPLAHATPHAGGFGRR